MTIAADQSQSWLQQHASANLVGESLPWLQQQRCAAIAHFEQVGLPGVRDEEWRYTNLRALKSNVYTLSSPSTQDIDLAPSQHSRLVFVDGHLSTKYSQVATLDGQASFISLAALLKLDPELVEAHFGTTLPAEQHGFSALNTAFFQDGYVLHLPQNCVLPEVLEVVFVASQQANENDYPIAHTRNLIIADANTKCTLVERHIGVDGSVYLNNSITEVIAQDNAHIDHYKIQQESSDAFHVGGVFIQQAANAQVKNHNIALSGLVVRNDINADLNGQGAHVEMNGLVIGNGRQHVDNHTQVNHAVANCSSDEYYKTILDDHSRSVFRGRIVVAQDAQLTSADQQNNNLLLSGNAEADSKPQLEIYADDVKCSHGATVGQLDPKSLFYLRSRGIDLSSATALLTFAFANEVIERIEVDTVRSELTQILAGQLLSNEEEG